MNRLLILITRSTVLLCCLAPLGCKLGHKLEVTTLAPSPDGSNVVALVEKDAFIDRNFEVRLFRTHESVRRGSIVFVSPDEGLPVGTERFIWSQDARYILLLGKHFFLTNEPLQSGDQLYLLYDTKSQKVWCNSPQKPELPRFTLSELAKLKFGSIGEGSDPHKSLP